MDKTVETQHEQRRRGLIVAKMMPFIPDDWNIQDGYNFLYILYAMGYFDRIPNLAVFELFVHNLAEIDSNGRITILRLYHNRHLNHEYNLPPIIERLQKLKNIAPGQSCQSIPLELGNLPHLETLDLQFPPRMLYQNIPQGMQFSGLKSIILNASHKLLSPSIVELLRNRFHSLERLCIMDGGKAIWDQILHALQKDDYPFRQSLKTLDLHYDHLTEEDLETILFEILPRFPNVDKLEIAMCEIKSLRAIESRIKRSRTALPKNSLRALGTFQSNARSLIFDNPEENAAFLTILNTFDGICSLQCNGWDIDYVKHECAPDVQYLLRINHAGRKYITGGATEEGDKEGATTAIAPTSYRNKLPVKPIPPALWPLIFKRAYETSNKPRGVGNKKCATGMFYMLRNGSGLQDIIAMRQQQGESKINSGSSRNNDSNNINHAPSNVLSGASNKRQRER